MGSKTVSIVPPPGIHAPVSSLLLNSGGNETRFYSLEYVEDNGMFMVSYV